MSVSITEREMGDGERQGGHSVVETVPKGEVSEAGREERDRLVEVLTKGKTSEC